MEDEKKINEKKISSPSPISKIAEYRIEQVGWPSRPIAAFFVQFTW